MWLQSISFQSCLEAAWYKATKPENLVSGSKKAGISPFNPKAIKIPELLPSVTEVDTISAQFDSNSSTDPPKANNSSNSNSYESAYASNFSGQHLDLYNTRYENG